eukprot:824626-Alexandrium_andersonii.AAC.1
MGPNPHGSTNTQKARSRHMRLVALEGPNGADYTDPSRQQQSAPQHSADMTGLTGLDAANSPGVREG